MQKWSLDDGLLKTLHLAPFPERDSSLERPDDREEAAKAGCDVVLFFTPLLWCVTPPGG